MTTPNFLILGAPKAGTTALYAYLSQHPQVYMSPHKEPNFFAFEGAPPRYTGPGDSSGINRSSVTRLDAYLALFAGANGEAAVGEASPLYLQFPDAAHRIHHHVPDAKLIAILRNPVERAYSDFLYRRKNGNEPSDDPLVAFQSEDERLARGWSPYFGYLQKGRYADHLERYFSLFARDQITVFLFEDLRNEIDATLRKTFEFLGVDDAFRPDTSLRYSTSGVPRNAAVQRALNAAKKSRSFRAARQVLPTARMHRWYSVVQNRNLAPAPPMSRPVRAYLQDAFDPQIDRLGSLIGRDLSHWH